MGKSKCSVKACKSSYKTKLGFHKLPSNPVFRELWIDIISKENGEPFIPKEWCLICTKHFKVEDFSISTKIKRLLPYAVPSIFENGNCASVHCDRKAKESLVSLKDIEESNIKTEIYDCYEEKTPEEIIITDPKMNFLQDNQEPNIKSENYDCYRQITPEEISLTDPKINFQQTFGFNFDKTRNVPIQVDFQDILRERLQSNEKPHYLSLEKRHLIQQLDILLKDRNDGDMEAGFIIELVKTYQTKINSS